MRTAFFWGRCGDLKKNKQTNISVWLWIAWDGPLDWKSGALEWGVKNIQGESRTANGKLPSPGVRENVSDVSCAEHSCQPRWFLSVPCL